MPDYVLFAFCQGKVGVLKGSTAGILAPFMIEHLEGDCRKVLPTLPAKSVQTCITSPPYWRKRSYLAVDHPAKPLEIGQEPTVQRYIETLVGVFRQVARVLVSKGTLWLNIGDSYADKDSAAAAGVKNGDLLGLPWRLAMALQAEGWLLPARAAADLLLRH
jgi:hypothetical protein